MFHSNKYISRVVISNMRRRRHSAPVPSTPEIITVEKLSHEGRGIAQQSDGKVLFLDNALPGETVEFIYTKKHSRYSEGEVSQIIQASPERVEPPCSHFMLCGGCSLQHMDSATQLALKQRTVLEQLAHFGQTVPETILPPLSVGTIGYRRKARLGVRFVEKKERLLIGFREKQGRYLADISSCKVLDSRVGELITPLIALLSSLTVVREIAQIEVAIGDNQVALILRNLQPLSEEDEKTLLHFAHEHQITFYLQPSGVESTYLLAPEENGTELLYTLPDFGLTLYFSVHDFTQVNQEINKKMVKLAVDLLTITPEDKVLDLFCGLGNFSLPLATQAGHVTGVEGDEKMVERASSNAHRNNITNASFFAADLFKPLESHAWANERYTKILLDPPRSGALEIVSVIEKWSPDRIVYVSCNPATLARDAGILVGEQGYKLTQLGIIDMFPHTTHVESIALFEKNTK